MKVEKKQNATTTRSTESKQLNELNSEEIDAVSGGGGSGKFNCKKTVSVEGVKFPVTINRRGVVTDELGNTYRNLATFKKEMSGIGFLFGTRK